MKKISNKVLLDKYINELRLINSPNPRTNYESHETKAAKYEKEILRRMEKAERQ